MRAFIIAATLILLCAGGVVANDSAFTGVGGSLRPMRGEHPSVRMVRERVAIDVHMSHYRTVVDFEFQNASARPVTVTMGFPETTYGADVNLATLRRSTAFRRFATFVDDQPITARRVVVEATEEQFRAYWTKEVTFAPNQTRRVRVEYEAPFSAVAEHFARHVPYDFTGGNWQGSVAESLLTVRIIASGMYLLRASFTPREGESRPLTFEREGASALTRRWTNWEAEGFFDLSFMRTLPDGLVVEGNIPSSEMYEAFLRRVEGEPRYRITVQPPSGVATQDVPNPPPALRRNGQVFITLEALRQWLDARAQVAGRGDAVELNAEGNSPTAMLRAGRRRIAFRVGSTTMRVDNARDVALPAAPFKINDYDIYVPLDAVMSALGGTARVNDSTRRVTLDAPAFW